MFKLAHGGNNRTPIQRVPIVECKKESAGTVVIFGEPCDAEVLGCTHWKD